MVVPAYGAYLAGIYSIAIGLLAIISPSIGPHLYGVELPPSVPSTNSPAQSSPYTIPVFLAAMAVREIDLGLLYLIFGYKADVYTVRGMMLVHVVSGAVHAFLAWRYRGEGSEKRPWTFGIGTAGLVLALAVAY